MTTDDVIGVVVFIITIGIASCACIAVVDRVASDDKCRIACGHRVVADHARVYDQLVCMCKEPDNGLKLEFVK